MAGEYRSHRIEPRTPSHGVRTRCSIFFLSEFCGASLCTLVELHHTGWQEAYEAKKSVIKA